MASFWIKRLKDQDEDSLAVDDSEYSAAATNEVARRPWPNGAIVRVLTVVEPFPPIEIEPWHGGA